jgi:hypothetical protein
MRKHLVATHGEKAIEAMEQWALMGKTECQESLIEKIADYRERNRAAKARSKLNGRCEIQENRGRVFCPV